LRSSSNASGVLPPIGKQKPYSALDLPVIHSSERGAPKGWKALDWKLIAHSGEVAGCFRAECAIIPT
jgi:hypothetical protein